MKKFKKLLAILLVASMIFTTNAVNVFAEGMNANQEEQLNEETTVGANVYGARPEDEENSTEAKLGEPEEEAEAEAEEELEETTVGTELDEPEEDIDENLSEPEEDTRRGERLSEPEEDTRRGERLSEPALDEEEPEEETEAESEIELELDKNKKDDQLYGDDPLVAYVYYIQYNDSTKKWEKKYETIAEGDNVTEKVSALWTTPNTPFIGRLANWYTINPTDPTSPDLDSYDQFKTTGSYLGTEAALIEAYDEWKDSSPTNNLHICAGFIKCYFYFFRLIPGESGAEKRKAECEEGKSDTEFNEFYEGKFNNIVSEGALGLYTFEADDPMSPSDDDYNEYKTGDKEYEFSLAGLKQAYDAWNDNPTKNICVGVMYTAPSVPPYMYWIVDGDGDNKTIHYYASATDGDGRTAVAFDENGVVYTSLSEGERNSIKKAVFEEPIVATDVRSYFKDFEGLVSITDIENLDISKVTSLAHMFDRCINIESLAFKSEFDTSNITDMSEMFKSLLSVTELDLTAFDTSKVTNMTAMFSDCRELTTVKVSENFKVDQVTDSENMFRVCLKISGGKGTKFSNSKLDRSYARIDRGTVKPGYFTGDPTTYIVSYDQNLPDGYSLSEGMTWYDYDESDDLSSSPITIKGSSDMTCQDASGKIRSLQSWRTLDFVGVASVFDFDHVLNDSSPKLFSDKQLTLSAVWSAPVEPPFMYWKVDGDDANKTIHYYATAGDGRTPVEIGANGIVYTGLDNQEKEKIKYAVFEGKEPIVASDVRSYFAGFKGLGSITGLDKLDTSKATSFADMFNNCSSIVNLDVSDLKTDSLTDTLRMFTYCRGAKSIKLGNNFNTIKVTNMEDMFSCCNALESITFGSNFDTRNVTNMLSMFVACEALEELDLTKFDTSKVTNMTNMFAQCGILKTIKVSDKFKVDQVAGGGGYMFFQCIKLVGGKGTIYDDALPPWGKTYAHIDEGSTNPGFFTAAPTPTPPTPPTPSPTPSYDDNDRDGSSTAGPITGSGSGSGSGTGLNSNLNTYTINNIPLSALLNDPALYLQLMSYPENTYMQKTNAKDIHSNTGYGRWMRIPNTTTWYFYAGDFNGVGNAGFLKDGWFNLGWDGVDRWYRFDSNGVMQLGWFEENGKIYFLQNDLNDNWYGKAVTGTHVIDGKTYTFDANGVLIG